MSDMNYQSLGMDLSDWCSSAALVSGDQKGNFETADAWECEAPNVCVLPRFPGEKPRVGLPAADSAWARGLRFPKNNHLWPNLGRIPAWLTWLALGQAKANPQWCYQNAEGKTTRLPLKPILQAHVAALLTGRPPQAVSGLRVVAIPDHFEERGQENVLNSLPGPRADIRLLWRSVAACLSWTSTQDTWHQSRLKDKRIAVVDVGNADVTATVLQMRQVERGGRRYLVPKRDLPESGSSERWHTAPFDLSTSAGILDTTGEQYSLRELWQVCCGGFLFGLWNNGDVKKREISAIIEFAGGWRKVGITPDELCRAVAAAVSQGQVPGLPDLWDAAKRAGYESAAPGQACRASLEVVLREQVGPWLRLPGRQPDKVLLTGSLSRLLVGPGEPLAHRLAELMGVAGDYVGVAHGCALYGVREQAGLPTYLDTLPRFCIVGKDENLRDRDSYCDLVRHTEWEGGKEYRPNEEELKRLRNAAMILSGRRTIRFRLLRQDKEKQLEQEFHQAPLQNCMLSFDVRMRPAQGFARVRIIPKMPDLFGGEDVVLDWDQMKDGTVDPDGSPEFPCEPLLPNAWRIANYVGISVDSYIGYVDKKNWPWAAGGLEAVGRQMQSGTVYGSDPEGGKINALREALDQHRAYYEKTGAFEAYHARRRGDRAADALDKLKHLMRAASALFRKTPAWAEQFLEGAFRDALERTPEDPNPTPVFLNAAGRCFSRDYQVRLFVKCFDLHFKARVLRWRETGQSPGMTNWCKAFPLILRLNEKAVLHIERKQADSLAASLQTLLEAAEPKNKKRLPGPYKQAMFSLYFLLRFRARHGHDGIDFLTDWQHRSSVAGRIHENLDRNRSVGRSGQASLISLEKDENLQAALLRFLESKATAQDIVIMRKAHDESLEEDETAEE
ncbi:MAG: hypothetical protein IMZ62_18650 [Chloroflexi bacterium]|nr:hypothetical protein [Chloroflexota bacterium]